MTAGWIEFKYFRWQTMFVNDMNDASLRSCAMPKKEICPTVVVIPKNSEVRVSQELKFYIQSDGKRATWRNVKYMSQQIGRAHV